MEGEYNLSFIEAQQYCESNFAYVATYDQLVAAANEGKVVTLSKDDVKNARSIFLKSSLLTVDTANPGIINVIVTAVLGVVAYELADSENV